MLVPGLCGHEGRVRKHLKKKLSDARLETRTDRLGNLISTLDGDPGAPSVMLFTHMDQLGFIVREIDPERPAPTRIDPASTDWFYRLVIYRPIFNKSKFANFNGKMHEAYKKLMINIICYFYLPSYQVSTQENPWFLINNQLQKISTSL